MRARATAVGYATTDLAAIRYCLTSSFRATRAEADVVGSPQEQYLSMIFSAARELGWLAPPRRAEHVAFGSVLGADRKMLKESLRDAVRLIEPRRRPWSARARSSTRNPPISARTRSSPSRMVGIGAVKYADLSTDRVKDYVYDPDRMIAFEGNTAGYLQYAHARIHSMMRKAGADGGVAVPGAIQIADAHEKKLALALLGFGSAVASVEASLEPHRLAGYLHGLATTFFTAFYEACPVLKSEGPTRASRLALAELTARATSRWGCRSSASGPRSACRLHGSDGRRQPGFSSWFRRLLQFALAER
ncbi:MAG: arginine--tRNA ligase [Polyangiaceae bacterium]